MKSIESKLNKVNWNQLKSAESKLKSVETNWSKIIQTPVPPKYLAQRESKNCLGMGGALTLIRIQHYNKLYTYYRLDHLTTLCIIDHLTNKEKSMFVSSDSNPFCPPDFFHPLFPPDFPGNPLAFARFRNSSTLSFGVPADPAV